MKKLNHALIEETHEKVVHQGEPQPVLCFEHRIGNLRGLLAYLANSIDTLEERRADEYGAVDANADGYLTAFREELAAAQEDVVALNAVASPGPTLFQALQRAREQPVGDDV